MAMSDRQQRILNFLEQFTGENGYPPTIREIGKNVGISSTSVVNYNLEALQRMGHIYRDRTVSRGIRLVEPSSQPSLLQNLSDLIKVPLLGRIAAGNPIPVPEGAHDPDTDMVDVTKDMVSNPKDVYALKVQGQSMIDALINDGDIVIMRRTSTAENGDMVAAWLVDDEETTLKRFFHEGERVRLQPENKTMQPIYVPSDRVEIQGRVVGVMRNLN